MTQFQVRPKNEKESEQVQRALFELGYFWPVSGKMVLCESATVLLCKATGFMSIGNDMYADTPRFLSEYPVAKADKIIARAVEKLIKTNIEDRRMMVGDAIDDAWGRLGIEPYPVNLNDLKSGSEMASGGIIDSDKPVELPLRRDSDEGKAAIATLESMKYTYHGGERWKPPLGKAKTFDPFWMVVGNGPTHVRHYSREEAVEEAKRLAQKQPGTIFVVLGPDAAYKAESPEPVLYTPGEVVFAPF